MDIEKIFNLPTSSSGGSGGGGNKRKLNAPTAEMLKKYKTSTESDGQMGPPPAPSSSNGSSSRVATVSNEEEEEEELGYQGQDESFADEDDEGRFFGGGLNQEQKEILDIFDKAGDDEDGEESSLTLPALRRQLARFERVVAKNAEQRGKFPDDPSRFIDSESDLDAAIKKFLPLTQNPIAYYPELVNSGAITLLAGLLSHENTDIAIDAIEVLQELTDEDVGAEVDDLNADQEGKDADEEKLATTRLVMAQLIDGLLENSIFELLVSNLERLDESEDADRQGVFQALGVFENLLSFMPPLADQIASSTKLIPWLLNRVKKIEHDSNRQYASEILAILLQDSSEVVTKILELEGMDALLMSISQYRKKDPVDSEELEFMENMFNCLCALVSQAQGKKAFLESEGVELMVIIMKEKLLARSRAIKVLDFALQTDDGIPNCERFVEVLGLKTFFSAFMGRGENKSKKAKMGTIPASENEEHLLGILASLFTNLASDTPPRIRLIAKFVESNYEKVDRLLEMREAAESRLKPVEKEIAEEREIMKENEDEIDEEQEDEWYLRRMDAGLSALQNADYVLAWVAMEDDGARTHARLILARKSQTYQNVVKVLQEFYDHIGGDVDGDEDEDGSENVQKMAVGQLISFLSA